MSFTQFDRHVLVTVAGNGEEARTFGVDFDISFDVSRTNAKEPNEATVTIMNLAKASRGAFETEYKRIWIEAGYTNNFSVIFAGEIDTSVSAFSGDSVTTRVSAGDGDLAWTKGAINESFSAGTPVKTIIRRLVRRGMPGVTVGPIVGLDDAEVFDRPYVANGATRDRLDEIARTFNAQWSVQNGEFEMIAADQTSASSAVVLNKDTGMIDSPAKTEKGIRVRCLLNGALKPNDPVIVESEVLTPTRGVYKIVSVVHRGSTHQNTFYSIIDCVSAADSFIELQPTAEQAENAARV